MIDTGDCSFYEEVESALRCGKKGYPVAYADRYCNRFRTYRYFFTAAVSMHALIIMRS